MAEINHENPTINAVSGGERVLMQYPFNSMAASFSGAILDNKGTFHDITQAQFENNELVVCFDFPKQGKINLKMDLETIQALGTNLNDFHIDQIENRYLEILGLFLFIE